jgi:hypothetical protein
VTRFHPPGSLTFDETASKTTAGDLLVRHRRLRESREVPRNSFEKTLESGLKQKA